MSATTDLCARVPGALSDDIASLGTWLRHQADQRQPRPWLGSVGIALAVSAVLLVGTDFTVPLLAVCAWWWCPRLRFSWILPLGLGVIGAAWVTVGAGLIAILPLSTAGPVWAWIAAMFAAAGALARALTSDRSA